MVRMGMEGRGLAVAFGCVVETTQHLKVAGVVDRAAATEWLNVIHC